VKTRNQLVDLDINHTKDTEREKPGMKACIGSNWLMVEPSGVLLRTITNFRILQKAGNFSAHRELLAPEYKLSLLKFIVCNNYGIDYDYKGKRNLRIVRL
jgi:hypothetical protein